MAPKRKSGPRASKTEAHAEDVPLTEKEVSSSEADRGVVSDDVQHTVSKVEEKEKENPKAAAPQDAPPSSGDGAASEEAGEVKKDVKQKKGLKVGKRKSDMSKQEKIYDSDHEKPGESTNRKVKTNAEALKDNVETDKEGKGKIKPLDKAKVKKPVAEEDTETEKEVNLLEKLSPTKAKGEQSIKTTAFSKPGASKRGKSESNKDKVGEERIKEGVETEHAIAKDKDAPQKAESTRKKGRNKNSEGNKDESGEEPVKADVEGKKEISVEDKEAFQKVNSSKKKGQESRNSPVSKLKKKVDDGELPVSKKNIKTDGEEAGMHLEESNEKNEEELKEEKKKGRKPKESLATSKGNKFAENAIEEAKQHHGGAATQGKLEPDINKKRGRIAKGSSSSKKKKAAADEKAEESDDGPEEEAKAGDENEEGTNSKLRDDANEESNLGEQPDEDLKEKVKSEPEKKRRGRKSKDLLDSKLYKSVDEVDEEVKEHNTMYNESNDLEPAKKKTKGKKSKGSPIPEKENSDVVVKEANEEEEESDVKVQSAKPVIIIEASNEDNSFKTRATKMREGLSKALPGADVLVNPEKPRKGCFEVRNKEGDVYVSLLNISRPFTKLKGLDLTKIVEKVVAKIN